MLPCAVAPSGMSPSSASAVIDFPEPDSPMEPPRAVGQLERDAVHDAAAVDLDDEVVHDETHATTAGVGTSADRCCSVGSVASRSASPSRLSDRTVTVIASPGQMTESGWTPM